MDETILFPSPNWFLVSGLAITKDGWLIYGGPSKSLCVLEPIQENNNRVLQGGTSFRTHVLNRVNPDRILTVDVCPEWPEKRLILTGSADGSSKLWNLKYGYKGDLSIKCILSHEIHHQEKEEVTGVGFSTDTYAFTVGSFGHIVKWDLNSNIVKGYNQFLKNFKPTCVSCSPHKALHVAVGTKQGVIVLLDLEGSGKMLYKVRAHNDDIVNISWCPQYNVTIKKTIDKPADSTRNISSRMDKIRVIAQEELKAEGDLDVLEQSGIVKNLPDDSFDNTTIVEEEDLFDVYKDHEAEEFGHKKFVPKEVKVKVRQELGENTSYLDECLKLKEEILQRKNQPEASIESLVEALDKTHVDEEAGTSKYDKKGADGDKEGANGDKEGADGDKQGVDGDKKGADGDKQTADGDKKGAAGDSVEASDHIHKHLLASISKHGGIKVWSKTGKLVATCVVPSPRQRTNKHSKNKSICPTLLWYKPDVLLMSDASDQLLACNPLVIDRTNRLSWRLVHSLHKRGLYYIGTDAPRVQDDASKMYSNYSIWTSAQDRNVIRYSYEKKTRLETLATCGGFIYTIQTCPYDARRVAVSVGDGAVRVWQSDTLDSDDTKLGPGQTTMYWQNVQGKVLTLAWHPTKENLLAFATAESRVGVITTSGGASERAAAVLHPWLRGGVYSLRWGAAARLYAAAAGDLYLYNADKPEQPPEQITISVDNIERQVSAIFYYNNKLVFGTMCGAVGVKTESQQTAMFVFSKMIHTIEWHPQQTSSSSDISQYKDMIAVCSMDKSSTIAILEYKEDDAPNILLIPTCFLILVEGVPALQLWKSLQGHLSMVLQLAWNPHVEGQLLSTSQDCTVRVWSIDSGVCTSIFDGHSLSALTASWAAFPQLSTTVMSGGGDCCLRLWNVADYPADKFDEGKHLENIKKDKKKNSKKADKTAEIKATEETSTDKEPTEEQQALLETKVKTSKKYLLPITSKQMREKKLIGLRKMLNQYLKSKSIEHDCEDEADAPQEFGADFVKMFGTINEVNEVLDMEMSHHKEHANTEARIMLCILRGQIDAAVSIASENEMLDNFILSVAPCVSFKYWKDVTQLYINQLDRLAGKQDKAKLNDCSNYGGILYRKMAALLSVHDVKGAVNALTEGRLFGDAYILCRTRYMDSIAEETLLKWAEYCISTGNRYMAAVCHFALGNLSQAATDIGASDDQKFLSLAAEVAKIAGQNTFAQRVEQKQALLKNNDVVETNEELDKLPSRIELVMKVNGQSEVSGQNGQSEVSGQNGHSKDHPQVNESVVKPNGDVETTM